MTDRLHSCRESPDGRHLLAYDVAQLGLVCRWCRRVVVSEADAANSPKHLADAHLGAVESV